MGDLTINQGNRPVGLCYLYYIRFQYVFKRDIDP